MKTLSALMLLFSFSAFAATEDFFSNKADALLCSTGSEGLYPRQQLEEMIQQHENASWMHSLDSAFEHLLSPAQSLHSVKEVLAPERLELFENCESGNPLCKLKALLGDEVSALRVLNIYYQTGIAIKTKGPATDGVFSREKIEMIERTVRRLSPSTLSKIKSHHENVDIIQADLDRGELGRTWGTGVALDIKIDYAAPGRMKRGKTLQIDGRQALLMHELGHVADKAPTQRTGLVRTFSGQDEWHVATTVERGTVWPWNNTVYCHRNDLGTCKKNELFAENFAQYIYMPKSLKRDAPHIYEYLRSNIFEGHEYEGFEDCPNPIFK